MQRSTTAWFLAACFSGIVLLAVTCGKQQVGPAASPLPLDDWHILEMVAHLNRAGLKLRLITVSKHGAIGPSVYLTATKKEWEELNNLHKDHQIIDRWKGVLYCERVTGYDPSEMMQSWGDDCLLIGPFLFYGDAEMLAHVRAALSQRA
jgi:hypothetical protein